MIEPQKRHKNILAIISKLKNQFSIK